MINHPKFSIFVIFNSKSPISSPSSKFIRIKIHEIAYPNKHTLGIHARSRSIFLLASLFTARFGSAPVPKPSLNPSPPPISPIIEPLSLFPPPLLLIPRPMERDTFAPYVPIHLFAHSAFGFDRAFSSFVSRGSFEPRTISIPFSV